MNGSRFGARATMAVSCGSFLALGLFTAALGPALPGIAAGRAIPLTRLGTLFTALFLGALLAQVLAGPLLDRLGPRPVLFSGMALLALGACGITVAPSLPYLLALAAIAGLGHGAVDIATNVLISRVFAARNVAALNLVNLFYGLGAVVGPAVAGVALRAWGTALPALWTGAALFLLLLPLLLLLTAAPPAPQGAGPATAQAAVFRSPLLWLLSTVLLLYVGVEAGTGAWTATYLMRTTPLGPTSAALATAGFWLALTAGRGIAALLGDRVAPDRLLLVSLAGAVGGALCLMFSTGHTLLSEAAVLLLGVSFGPVFPTVLAIITASLPRAAGTACSVAIAMGSVGGMFVPWLQGLLLGSVGPRASVIVLAAGTVGMLALHSARRRAALITPPA